MAKVGRPPANWKSVPVSGELLSVNQVAEMLGMKVNTLHQQLKRDRGLCVTDGHAIKQPNGRWNIHSSIKQAFEQ